MPAPTDFYPQLKNRAIGYKDAKLLYDRDLPVWDTREIALFWPVTNDKHMREAVVYLDTYCSSKNANAQSWVQDPWGSGEVFYGTWRLVENRMSKDGEPDGIVQILREGWATTLADDEAIIKLGPIQGAPIEETYTFVRYWRNINPSSVEALALALNATKTVTSPKVQGNTKTGTYAVSGVTGNIIPGDGTGIIQQTLAFMTVITDETTLDTMGRRKLRKNEILNLFGIQEGEGDYMAFMFYGINPSSEDALFNIADASLVTKFASGWTYLDRDFKIVADGTANFTIAFRKTAWLAGSGAGETWDTNKKEMTESNASGWGEVEHDQLTGIRIGANLDTAYAAAKVTPSATTRIVTQAQLTERANGEGSVSRTLAKVSVLTDETDVVVIEIGVGLGNAKASVARVWRKRTSAAMTTLTTAAGAAISAFTYATITYTHSSVRITDHPDGSYTVTQIGVKADSWFAYIPHDQVGPILKKLEVNVLRTGAGVEQYAAYLVATWQKLYDNAADAASFADESSTTFTDHATESIQYTMGGVEYIGKDWWRGLQVQTSLSAAKPWDLSDVAVTDSP